MRVVIVEQFLNSPPTMEEGDSLVEVVERVFAKDCLLCLSPNLVQLPTTTKIPGAVRFVDEGTHEGWGPGCTFAGQTPNHQIIVEAFPV